MKTILILFTVFITYSSFPKIESKEKEYIEFVSYEIESQQHYNEGNFDVRIAIKFFPNGEAEVFERFYKRYEHYKLENNKELYNELFSLGQSKGGLKYHQIKEKMANGFHFGGAHSYLLIKTPKSKDEICYISPLMSERFNKIIEKIYLINDDDEKKKHQDFNEKEILKDLEKRIMLVHREQKPHKVELPPPSMD